MRDPLGQLRLRYAGLRLVRDSADAEVYSGRDYRGNDVTVMVLTEAASADPERRQEFAAAVADRATGDPGIAGSDPAADRPWVAVASRPGAVDLGGLLAGLDEPAEPADDERGVLPGLGDGEPGRLPRLPPAGGRIPSTPRTVAPTDRVPPPPGPVAAPTRVPPPPVTPHRPDRSPPPGVRSAGPVGAGPTATPPVAPQLRTAGHPSGTSSGVAIAVGVLVMVVLVGICCAAALLA